MIVEELVEALGLKLKEEEWERGEHAIEHIKEGLEKLKESSFGETIKKGLELFAGYEAIHTLHEWTDSVVEAGVGAKRLGERIGITSDAVQELSYAADVNGSSAEELQQSMQILARSLEELRTKGTGPAADGLKVLGLHFSAVKNKSPDQVLAVLADRFAAMPDGAKKTAAAMDLFGRSGTSLIPLLNKGAAGIAELRAEAEKLGIVISKEGIEKAEQFEETQKKLSATLTGIKNEAITALLPAFNSMGESVLKWVQANRALIQSKIQQVIPVIVSGLKAAGKAALYLVDVLGWMEKHWKLTAVAAGALFAIFSPWTAALTAVVAIVYDLWNAFANGEGVAHSIYKWFADGFAKIEKAVHNFVQTVKDAWEKVKHIPIIGHIIRGGIATVRYLEGNGQGMQGLPTMAGGHYGFSNTASPSVAKAQSYSAPVQVQGGDVHIAINGGDPEVVKRVVKEAVKDAQNDMLRQAQIAVKGGLK